MMKGKTKKFTDQTNSPAVCRSFCRPDEGEKYKYYAMQNGNECYCADVLHRVEEKPDSDCDDRECKGTINYRHTVNVITSQKQWWYSYFKGTVPKNVEARGETDFTGG